MRCKKQYQKILFVARTVNFRKLGFVENYYKLVIYKRNIHLDTVHARNLKFGMYLPCMPKILKNLKIAASDLWTVIQGRYMPNFKFLACMVSEYNE